MKKRFDELCRIEGGRAEPETIRGWLAGYGQAVKALAGSGKVMLPVVLTLIFGYGFTLLHPSVSVDDTAIGWYMDEGQILLQGRFFPYLIQRILPVYRFQPVVTDLLAVLAMTAGMLLLSCLFDRAADGEIPLGWRTAFICIALSYPLIAEIFIYMQVSFTIGLGYLLSALAAAALYSFWKTGKKRFWAAAGVLSCLLAGSFESFLAVVIGEAVMLLLLQERYGAREDRPVRRFLLRMISCGGAIAAGLVLKAVIMAGIRMTHPALFATGVNPSQNEILWGAGNFSAIFSELMRLLTIKYLYHALSYLPIGIYAVGFFGCLAAAIWAILQKRGRAALEWAVLAGSTQALSLVQGDAQRYRTDQCFAVFVGFLVMMAGSALCRRFAGNGVRTLAGVCAGVLCLLQAQDLNRWFSLDYARWQYEERLLTGAAQAVLEQYGDERPVIFVGSPSLPDTLAEAFSVPEGGVEERIVSKIYRAQGKEYVRPWLTETLQSSVVGWAVSALDGSNGQLRILLAWEGYDFPACTPEQFEEAEALELSPGEIVDCGEYIVVNLGS
jgi:hypothetical protein